MIQWMNPVILLNETGFPSCNNFINNVLAIFSLRNFNTIWYKLTSQRQVYKMFATFISILLLHTRIKMKNKYIKNCVLKNLNISIIIYHR